MKKRDINEIRECFEKLSEEIKKVVGARKAYYRPNPGNLGDALIRQGTEAFLKDHEINAERLPLDAEELLFEKTDLQAEEYPEFSELKEAVLIYGGGGGWCKTWTGGKDAVMHASKHFHHTLVLPSTFETPTSISNCTLYARDRFESIKNAQDAKFCHDMAFYLLFSPIFRASKNRTHGTAFCFRKDKESNIKEHWKLPLSNVDLSWKGDYLDSASPMLEYVATHQLVHTDRLHVAVSCCLTNTPFCLYPGAYFKNRAIFETTMAPYFEIGTWRERLPLKIRIANKIERKIKRLLGH